MLWIVIVVCDITLRDKIYCFVLIAFKRIWCNPTSSQWYLKGMDISQRYLNIIKLPSDSKKVARGHSRPLKEASFAFTFQTTLQNC